MKHLLNFLLLFALAACDETFSIKMAEQVSGPSIISITAPSNGTYYAGEVLTIRLIFSEPVTVNGTPRIQLDFDGVQRFANYTSGSGSATLTFQYTIAGVADMVGVNLLSNIDLNGGKISGTQDASSSFSAVEWTNVFVSGGPTAGPGVVSDNCPGSCTANQFERPDVVLIERLSPVWGPHCMGVVLSSRYILTTASCVDGFPASNLRIIAGLWDRTTFHGAQVQYVASHKMHEDYNFDPLTAAYANDLAIITLERPLVIGANVEVATLAQPADGTFVGSSTLTYSWIRSLASPLTDFLQVWSGANYPAITTADANFRFMGVPDALVWDDQIAIIDQAPFWVFSRGVGSPMYVDLGGGTYVLAGILSWAKVDPGTSGVDSNFPIVGTRISSYIAWITTNTP